MANQDEITILRSFDNSIEAHRAKAMLEDEGIECFLTDENISSLYPMMSMPFGGIKLCVKQSDAQKATQIIDA